MSRGHAQPKTGPREIADFLRIALTERFGQDMMLQSDDRLQVPSGAFLTLESFQKS
jgi:hypothetical protein